MIAGTIARRYAKALFDLALEAGKVEGWGQSLTALKRVVDGSPEVHQLLENPVYTREQRQAIASRLSHALGLDPQPAHLLAILADRNRLAHLTAVAETFARLVDQRLGRVRARVTSAVPLEESAASALGERLAQAARAQVVVERVVAPEILGGVVAQVGDMVYDGSIRAQLEELRRTLKG